MSIFRKHKHYNNLDEVICAVLKNKVPSRKFYVKQFSENILQYLETQTQFSQYHPAKDKESLAKFTRCINHCGILFLVSYEMLETIPNLPNAPPNTVIIISQK